METGSLVGGLTPNSVGMLSLAADPATAARQQTDKHQSLILAILALTKLFCNAERSDVEARHGSTGQ